MDNNLIFPPPNAWSSILTCLSLMGNYSRRLSTFFKVCSVKRQNQGCVYLVRSANIHAVSQNQPSLHCPTELSPASKSLSVSAKAELCKVMSQAAFERCKMWICFWFQDWKCHSGYGFIWKNRSGVSVLRGIWDQVSSYLSNLCSPCVKSSCLVVWWRCSPLNLLGSGTPCSSKSGHKGWPACRRPCWGSCHFIQEGYHLPNLWQILNV